MTFAYYGDFKVVFVFGRNPVKTFTPMNETAKSIFISGNMILEILSYFLTLSPKL